jgi:hypothetical protein
MEPAETIDREAGGNHSDLIAKYILRKGLNTHIFKAERPHRTYISQHQYHFNSFFPGGNLFIISSAIFPNPNNILILMPFNSEDI